MMKHGIATTIPLQAVHHTMISVSAALDGGAVKLMVAAFNDAARCRIAHSTRKTEGANRFKADFGGRACSDEQ
jgi:hypothetical protein